MPDEPFAISPSAPPPPTEADYEAIHAAVMETERGRWFLGEYARRNRHADTTLILAAIDRVEALWHQRHAASSAERVHFDLVEMAQAIAQTRSEIAAIKPDGDAKGSLSEATEELDQIVQTTERATSDILAAAEQVQEIAWTLRERGADHDSCDALDQRATDIYSACSFQDLTGQRIRKVVEVLHFLEDRIRAMIEIWGDAVPAPADAASPPHLGRDAADQLGQTEIDRIMPALDEPAAPAPAGNGHAGMGEPAFATDAVAVHAIDIGAAALPAAAAAAASSDGRAVSAESPTDLVIASAIVGATAMALDLSPIAQTPASEVAHAPEPAVESFAELATEPQAGSDTQADDIAASAGRSDPAAMLKRILALIRAPNGASVEVELADAPAESSGEVPAELVMTVAVEEVEAADDATSEAASTFVAEVSIGEPSEMASSIVELSLVEPAGVAPAGVQPTAEEPNAAEPSVGAAPIAETSIAHPLRVEVPVAEIPVAEAPDVEAPEVEASAADAPAGPGEIAAAAAPVSPAGGEADAADDILMPLTVDQAVDELLGKGTRGNGPLPRISTVAMAELLAPIAALPAAEIAAPGLTAAAPIEHAAHPFTLDVPEVTIAPLPRAPAALAPLAAHAEPEPPQPAEAPPAPQEAPPTPLIAAAEAPAALAPPVDIAAMPTPAPAVTAPPAPPARYPALAAIAALSDDEKIALFS